MNLVKYMKLKYFNDMEDLTDIKNINIRKDIKCNKCKVDEKDQFNLHTQEQFMFIVYHAIKLLNIEYRKDAMDYTNEELNLISCVVGGILSTYRLVTLCDYCYIKMYKRNGRTKDLYLIDEEDVILNRKNIKDSHAQIVVRWFKENMGMGVMYILDILESVGLSQEQFKEAKDNNVQFKKFINNRKYRKKGYYIV